MLGVPVISTSKYSTITSLCPMNFLDHRYFNVFVSTLISSLISLFTVSSAVSHFSLFHPGKTRKSRLESKSVRYLHVSSLISALVERISQSSVLSYFSSSPSFPLFILNLIVMAGSCLSLYPSFTSAFESVVAQLGHIHWTLNHLYTKFCLYIF